MVAKGRDPKPTLGISDSGNAKLTWDEVREIRKSRESVATMASQFGVSIYAIYDIRSGRTWPDRNGDRNEQRRIDQNYAD
jgi:hypothetical protein